MFHFLFAYSFWLYGWAIDVQFECIIGRVHPWLHFVEFPCQTFAVHISTRKVLEQVNSFCLFASVCASENVVVPKDHVARACQRSWICWEGVALSHGKGSRCKTLDMRHLSVANLHAMSTENMLFDSGQLWPFSWQQFHRSCATFDHPYTCLTIADRLIRWTWLSSFSLLWDHFQRRLVRRPLELERCNQWWKYTYYIYIY